MNTERIFKITFAGVYPMYIQKAEKKGKTKEEVDQIICWLTGYDAESLQKQIEARVDLKTFFEEAPMINPASSKITGVICGYRVEDIEDPIVQQIRYMDKLIDELTRGKAPDKILRK